MKKIMVSILSCVLIIMLTACGHYLELDTNEEIAEVYRANEECFNTAADTILKYDPQMRITISPIESAEKSEAYVGKEIGDLYIDSSSSLTDADYQILYDAFAPLMERYPLSGVAMFSSRVEFVLEGPTYGMAAELFYFADADFAASYTSQTDSSNCLMIDPHWYAEICHY